MQGFIAPGHVCTVVGCKEYEDLVRDFRIPIVVGGFEPVDILAAVLMLVRQLEAGEARLENQYVRSVSYAGNRPAQQIVAEIFEIADQKWRGIGTISQSGLRLREGYSAFDANRIFDLGEFTVDEPAECISALVLQGLKKPTDCAAFGRDARRKIRGSAYGFERRGVRGVLPLSPPRGRDLGEAVPNENPRRNRFPPVARRRSRRKTQFCWGMAAAGG